MVTTIGNTEIKERYIPKEEGLLEVNTIRTLSSITIKLSKSATE